MAAEGVIEGVVVNATRGHGVGRGTEVALRALFNGQFILLAQTVTSPTGKFRFTGLPLDADGPYLPGANQDGVHFPGPRVELTAAQPSVHITLAVFDAVSQPNPLVIEEHQIVVDVEPGCVRVRETMTVDNPSSTCYVGSPRHAGGGPVTLQLGVPGDFERITFDKEAFGRRFSLINGKLVTGIPWPPGKRELGFSYVIANERSNRTWQRQVDLPCSRMRLKVHADKPDQITCNLPPRPTSPDGEACVEYGNESLPAGYVVRLDLDGLPLSTIVLARWAALVVLPLLAVAVSVVSFRRRA
jgi:hypothetical protein